MKKTGLKKIISIVIACIMVMSIFTVIPVQAGAADQVPIAFCSISVPDCTFNGLPLYPEPTVMHGCKKLKMGVDFYVVYTHNTEVVDTRIGFESKPTVTVYGKGNYYGYTTVNFKIKPTSIDKCSIELSSTKLCYNEKAQTPKVIVKRKLTALSEGSDYTVSSSKGKYPGSYVIRVSAVKSTTSNLSGGYKELMYTIYLKQPSGVKFTKINENKIKVDWGSVSCDGYEIERYNGKKWVSVAKTMSSVYTAPYANKYRVRAYVNDLRYGKTTYSSWTTYSYYR